MHFPYCASAFSKHICQKTGRTAKREESCPLAQGGAVVVSLLDFDHGLLARL